MPRWSSARFEALPLLEAAAALAGRPACAGHPRGETICVDCAMEVSFRWADLSRALGLDPTAAAHWKHRGMDERKADEYATKLGIGPELIWTDYVSKCLAADELLSIEKRTQLGLEDPIGLAS